ncbi:MAG: inovirus-type Gp2 protein [Hydrogenophaga sp.]|nr:inovirus-type Gp2 protein [Hydrogenophaga sp.]
MGHPDFEKDISFDDVSASFAPIPLLEVDGGAGILLDDDHGRIKQVVLFESYLDQFARKGKNDRVLINERKVEECRKKGVMNYDSCMAISVQLIRLFSFFQLDEVEFRRSLGNIAYSPMVELFFNLYGNWIQIHPIEPSTSDTDKWLEFFRAKVSWKNAFLDSLYAAMTSKAMLEQQKSHRRSSRKNYQSACDYVDNLISRRSKVLILRFDVAYKKYQQHLDMSRLGSSDGISADRALLDREKFIKLLKKAFSNAWLGYIWKLEYRPRKGYHFHMLVFLDGHKSMFDFNLVDQAGQIWIQEITHGVGVYYNCNRSAYRYLKDGTGMLLRTDKDKIVALKKAVGYLTKIDLLIRPKMLSRRRTFGKGEMVLGSKKTQDVRAALAEQRRAVKQQLPVVRPFDPSGRF